MGYTFTKIRSTAPEEIQMNAGLLLTNFDPSTGTVADADILACTTGGLNFTATPAFVDFGEDVDNCPKNTMELKEIDDIEVKVSGTFLTVTDSVAKFLAGAADTETVTSTAYDVKKVTPRKTLEDTDFQTLWVVGDRGKAGGGFVAIKIMNGLNTGGFQMQTADKGKGNFAVDITGHYSIDDPETVPYEVYVASKKN